MTGTKYDVEILQQCCKKKKVKNKGHKVSKTNSYRGIQSKECYFMFTYSFLSFFIKKFVFSSFSFLFLWSLVYVNIFSNFIFIFSLKYLFFSKFRNRILIIQKLELMMRNCQWNCMRRKQPSAHLHYYLKTQARGIFGTLSNIYDRVICKHR